VSRQAAGNGFSHIDPLADRWTRHLDSIESVVLPEVPEFDGPVEIHMDTGFEYLPGSVDTGEGC